MIICADDFGLRPEHDDAILELARAGRISATPWEDLRPRKFKNLNFTALFFRPQRADNDIFRHYQKKAVRAHQAQN